ncbi:MULTISPECIES: hypothetical protein [Microbacterium]|uniref:hypothetical protein n=1 Tax=Microbacterium TaxID=33882 RepID=UPI001EF60E3E|nr:hypothetical protein [Microbacterium aurum]MCG7415430.1 hypothetical protein [Microbacterium aurum]
MTTEQTRFFTDAQVDRWKEIAYGARVFEYAVARLDPPDPASQIAQASRFVPGYPVDDWCRSFLAAAYDNLLLWADYATPLRPTPDVQIVIRLRPALTIARAAMESAAQAVWVLSATTAREMAERHVRLFLWDLDEQQKAATTAEWKQAIRDGRSASLAFLGIDEQMFKAPSYLEVIRGAAKWAALVADDERLDDRPHIERVWRTCAGAAHGKRWPANELMKPYSRPDGTTIVAPDPAVITDALDVADAFASVGALTLAQKSGGADRFRSLLALAPIAYGDL